MYRSSPLTRLRRTAENLFVGAVAVAASVGITIALMNHSHPTTSAATATTIVTHPSTTTTPPTSPSTTLAPTPVTTPVTTPVVSPISNVVPVSGVVTSVTNASVTISSRTGGMLTYSFNPTTVVMSGRLKTTISSVHVGSSVYVVSSPANPHLAVAIGIMPATHREPSDNGSGDN